MIGLLRRRWLFTLVPRTVRYLGDSRVPFYYKVLPFLFIPLFFTPVSLALNLIPVVGLLDDFTILLLCLGLFTFLSARAIKRYELRQAAKGNMASSRPPEVIEGNYQVLGLTAKPTKTKEAVPADAHQLKRPNNSSR